MTEKEKFIFLVDRDEPVAGDAIILLQGDGLARVPRAAELYHAGYAPLVVLSGSAPEKREYGTFAAEELLDALLAERVPREAIHHEDRSTNTREQALEAVALAAARGWRTLLLVGSPHHQYRAFLTFLKARNDAGLSIRIVNATPRDLSLDEETGWGRRADLLAQEWERIEAYAASGHLASYATALAYFGETC